MTPFAILTLLIVALIGTTAAYSTPKSTSQSQRQTSATVVNRSTFLATAASTCLAFLASSPPAFAKDVDPALKGTKADPEFQACLSQCVYECTKPKGMEQRNEAADDDGVSQVSLEMEGGRIWGCDIYGA
ncbi:predicted protein [Thalassiosira pseudonana CCMP1335]|uniref:Uncharacterized protein n=1 Tax=Thalassiosira pseudonana TaxID=35128 RepID=B8CG77_THAPS|nr:predicted protein [Thalassiosira pseudonana CCMP1335]EED87441.1 predicted protein [Thalassiosira pseudonana CCMP1335]